MQSATSVQPFWDTFALLREQVERLVALNLFWAVQLIPGIVGLAFDALPLLLRTVLVGSSLVLIVPASLSVYTVVAGALAGSEITFADIRRAFRQAALPSLQRLAPLYGLLALLLWANLSLPEPFSLLIALRLALLCSLTCSMYWGPLLSEDPQRSPAALLSKSLKLVLTYPAQTLGALFVSVGMLAVSVVSIGGLFLIVFVLLACYHTRLLHSLRLGENTYGTAPR